MEEVFQEYMKDANFYRNQSDARLKQIRMAMNIVACTEKDPEILSMIKLFAEEAQTEITERRSNACINLVEAYNWERQQAESDNPPIQQGWTWPSV